ncbi:DNA cytosine methyltransferase [Elizabethkingia anophelis]|uniref:DNA cytosine methyltransferase n=1 Tax=Elizabethkingia anophelis TaxID=1117645 RepID=UPI00389283C7|nr:DNA cytosine methyltransferase [Elizabethkingia anophelis]
MKILNLCAGVGGNAKKWEVHDVTAVENEEKIAAIYQKVNPEHTVIVADAYEYLKKHYNEFDFVWISPPCQKHSRMMKATRHKVADYPDFKLYEVIIFLKHFFKGKWVVENVVPYYTPLITPTAKIGRHLFWSNFEIQAEEVKQPKGFITKANLQGKKEMMDWLGIHFDEVVYYKKNHCPVQILRNCVHPDLGKQILECALNETPKKATHSLFDDSVNYL